MSAWEEALNRIAKMALYEKPAFGENRDLYLSQQYRVDSDVRIIMAAFSVQEKRMETRLVTAFRAWKEDENEDHNQEKPSRETDGAHGSGRGSQSRHST